ncbi:pentatricopeptide repeat-containing protein At3g57430, chloroplastic [Fagus crenata]
MSCYTLPFSSRTFTLSSLQSDRHTVHSQPLTTTATSSAKPLSESRSQDSWVESLRFQARSNHFREAIFTYIQMTQADIPPDNFAFPAVLKAVAGLQDLNFGKQIHAHVFKFGYASSSVTVANTLVNMYGKCGDVGEVYKVFERITERDQVSWNSVIAALCRFQEWELALEAFQLMLFENVAPSSFTLVSVALACSNLPRRDGLRLGKQVHAYSLRTGNWRTYTNNALMSMYAKLGRVGDSRSLFDLFEDRDLVSWNTMISLLSQNDQFLEALLFLRLMVLEGIIPDGVTFASVLPACSHLEMLDRGKEIHVYALKNTNLVENSFVGSALVDMYCNCQQVESGRRVFDGILERSIALFNAMITGYAQNEHDEKALNLFFQMEALDGICPNATTMSSVLPACVSCELFSDKEGMHGYVIKRGLERDRYVQNALMDMYSRMGKIKISKYIFNCMERRDIVSWNTMITGYVICGRHDHALNLLNQMQGVEQEKYGDDECEDEDRVLLKPNSVTLMTVLPGCAALAALAKGKEIHAYAIRHLLASDVAVGSALVDMYGKCGCLNLSRRVFDRMPIKNVITWNVIIMAYGMHGKGEEALELFKNMATEGEKNFSLRPNQVTFIAIFAACSHSGMVENGKKTLILHGTKTSAVLNSVLKELYHLKKGSAVKFSRKNENIKPFESGGETSLEFFSLKTDCSVFVYGSHSKKRPDNLVIGRTYDHHIYDLVEVGVENFRPMESFTYDKKLAPLIGSKPLIAFIGEGFENVEELKHLKEVLIDLLRGEVVENLNLVGLDRVYVCTAISSNRVFLSHCGLRLKKSGTKVPRMELVEMGPSMDLVVRRHRLPNDGLRKEAMKTVRDQPKKKMKNVSQDAVQGKIGKIYMPDQKVGDVALPYKAKGLKRERREAKLKNDDSKHASKKQKENST